jgi:hypothetical protein
MLNFARIAVVTVFTAIPFGSDQFPMSVIFDSYIEFSIYHKKVKKIWFRKT